MSGRVDIDRMRQMLAEGATFQDVATEFGVSREYIRQLGLVHSLTSERAKIRRQFRASSVLPLLREGLSPKQISQRLGVTYGTVTTTIRRAGISVIAERHKARAARSAS